MPQFMNNKWGPITTALLCMGVVGLGSLTVQAEEDYTVHTVEQATAQIEDERFASGMVTRQATDEIFWRGADLAGALLGVTGVYVRQSSSPGQPSYLSVRGGNPRQLVVELDGLRLSSPAGPGFDFGQFSTEGLSSADVYRGSAASVYGGGAVTGAVRLNPEEAHGGGWQVRGRSLAGSFGTTGLSGAAAVGDESMGLRLHTSIRQARGDFSFVDDQGATQRRLNNDHRRIGAGGTAHLGGQDHRFRLTGLWESGGAGASGPAEFQEAFQFARRGDQRGLMALRWDRRGVIDSTGLIVDAYATGGAQRQVHHYLNEESFLGRQRFESRAAMHTASATGGAVALVGDSHLARLDAAARVETYRGETENGDTHQLSANRVTASISVADEWLIADERLSLIAAIRAEASSEGGDQAIVEPLLPALGVIVRPHSQIELRANGARTFRLPDFDELYLDTEAVRGNPDLEPERAWTMDAGLAIGAADAPVRWEVAYFRNAIESMILFLPQSAYLFEAQNLYGATTDGLEASGHWRPAHRWSMDVGYTYTRAFFDGEYAGDRPQLPGIPRHRVSARSALDLTGLAFWSDLPELVLTSSAHYRSPINLDNFGSLQNGSSLLIDLGVTAGLGQQFRAGVFVNNLLDHRSAQDSLQRPLPGRSAFLSLEMIMEGQ